jgi:hypothetical protein
MQRRFAVVRIAHDLDCKGVREEERLCGLICPMPSRNILSGIEGSRVARITHLNAMEPREDGAPGFVVVRG